MDNGILKRSQFKKDKNFGIVNSHWFQTKRNKPSNTGDLGALMLMADEKYRKEGNQGIMPYDYWKNFYFASADLRMYDPDTEVAGRTPADFREMAYDIKKETYEFFSIVLPIVDIEKAIIILVLDKAYLEYIIVYNALTRMRKVYPTQSHNLVSASIKHEYGIDICSTNKETGKIQAVFTVKSQDFDFGRRSKNQPYLNEYLHLVQKHDKYYIQNKIRPQFLIVDKAGIIKSPVFNLR